MREKSKNTVRWAAQMEEVPTVGLGVEADGLAVLLERWHQGIDY